MIDNKQIQIQQPILYQTVSNELKLGKKNHAYLIEGNNALEYAKFIAKSLLCDKSNDICCNQCRVCQQIENNQFIDMKLLDGNNGTIKKNMIEEVQNEIYKTSVEGRGKIYIIHNLENATTEALNSLLKILEEPVDGIYAIFTCENLKRILPTIISRCQVFRLKPQNQKEIKANLIQKGIMEEKANILVNVCSTVDQMEQLNADENFDDLIKEAMNFIDDYYNKKENLYINTHIHLVNKFKEKKYVILFFDLISLGFKDILNYYNDLDLIFIDHEFLKYCKDDVHALIHKIEAILEIRNDLNSNINLALAIDHLIYNL